MSPPSHWLQIDPGISPTNLRIANAATVADTAQLSQLTDSLRRYIAGSEPGRSYLISGHRGSGKTTLVDIALQKLTTEPTKGRTPLLIKLNSSTLLQDVKIKVDSSYVKLDPLLSLCNQLTCALTDAIIKEFLYRLEKAEIPQEYLFPLRMQLKTNPRIADLLEVWELLPGSSKQLLGKVPGEKEIETLWKSLQLHQITSGTRSSTIKDDKTDNRSLNQEATLTGKLSELLPSAWAILVGGGASLGLLTADPDEPFFAVIGGFVAALFAATTLTITAKHDQTNNLTHNDHYHPDYTAHALPRMLPKLAEQIWSAGLAPVFIIDELDKVALPKLITRMEELIRHLKSFVTERSAFFFLVDRGYFEHVEGRSQREVYPIEYTYFSERIYVSYLPSELEEYLKRVLLVDHPLAAAVLRKGLLLRSRSHFSTLRIMLKRLVLERAQLPTQESVLSARGWQCALSMQLAVEHTLRGDRLQQWMTGNRYLAQLALNTVYYPARKWADGRAFTLTPDALRRWLVELDDVNMLIDTPAFSPEDEPDPPNETDTAQQSLETPSTPVVSAPSTPQPLKRELSAEDLDLLFESYQQLERLLREPDLLKDSLRGADESLKDLLPSRPLLASDPTHPGILYWQYTTDGHPLPPPPTILPFETLEEHLTIWCDGALSLKMLLKSGLILDNHSTLVDAAERQRNSSLDYPERSSDIEATYTLQLLLEEHAWRVEAVLIWVVILVRLSDTNTANGYRRALEVLSSTLSPFPESITATLGQRTLLRLLQLINPHTTEADLPWRGERVGWANLNSVLQNLTEASDLIPPEEMSRLIDMSWGLWQTQAEAWLHSSRLPQPSELSILTHHLLLPASPYLRDFSRPKLEEFKTFLANWSRDIQERQVAFQNDPSSQEDSRAILIELMRCNQLTNTVEQLISHIEQESL